MGAQSQSQSHSPPDSRWAQLKQPLVSSHAQATASADQYDDSQQEEQPAESDYAHDGDGADEHGQQSPYNAHHLHSADRYASSSSAFDDEPHAPDSRTVSEIQAAREWTEKDR